MKPVKIIFAVVGILAAAVAASLFLLPNAQVKPATAVSIEIPRGTGTRRMGEILAGKGVVASSWHFLAARALRPNARLQAGEYDFSESASAAEILDRLVRGDIHLDAITIPEGSNIWDVADITAKLGWFPADEFLKAAQNSVLITELLPDVKPAPHTFEGYLFPSTYKLTKGMTPRQIIAQMTKEFHKVWLSLDAKLPVQEAVTLASLVETEAKRSEERATVASVYRNRIDQGMFLGCDPTVMYAARLDGRYRGKIYKSDLESENPYNTYNHRGLPPGPIASPGEASLRAALHPAETKFIYFVAKADGSGGHNFSENAAEHNRAVAHYRQAVAAQK